MPHSPRAFWFLMAACSLVACDETKSLPAPPNLGASSNSPAAASTPSAAPPASAAVAASAAPITEPPVDPVPVPPEKGSLAPSAVDWKKAPKIPIAHAAALGCEVAMLREWIKVACKETPLTDVPASVKFLKEEGAKGRLFKRAAEGKAHVIIALRKGVDVEAAFGWRTPGWGTRVLTARYAEGMEHPAVAFDRGAPGPEESPIGIGQVPGEKPHAGRMLYVPPGAAKGKAPIEGFLLDETEVTFWALRACIEAGACAPVSGGISCARHIDDPDPLQPVNCITYEQAETYCKWADKRLPTAQEWWYAMTSTDGRPYPWGSAPGVDHLCDYQQHKWTDPAHGKGRLMNLGCKVGAFPTGKGPFGHYDMLSNVAEWTSTDDADKKVVMGGSFGQVSGIMDWREYWAGLMKTMRETYATDTQADNIGFRCARTPPAGFAAPKPAGS